LRIATYPLDRYAARLTIVQYIGDDLRSSNYWTLNRAWSLSVVSMMVDDIVSVFNDVRNNARRLKGGRFVMISSKIDWTYVTEMNLAVYRTSCR